MSIKKLSFMLLSALSLAALLNGCGSSSKEGTNNPGGVARVADESVCRVCHSDTIDPVSRTPIVTDFLTSAHFTTPDPDNKLGCEGCHGGGAQHNGVGPIPFPNPLTSNRCITCHTAGGLANTTKDLTPLFELAKAGWASNNCAHCHTATKIGSVHGALVPSTDDCISCHDVAAPQHAADLVGDNNGVRAIVPEFTKRSHHITGGTPNSAQCAVCHLEGTVNADGAIVVDANKHMTDNKVHLRNADTDADMAWGGTEHTNMDNFCFSCHDSDGATSPLIATFMNNQNFGGPFTPKNPFADTLTNSYDQVARAGVVDVKTAFTTTNASHHAVSGQRYKYRFSTLANAQVWAARTGNPVPAANDIAEGHTDLDGNPIPATAFEETMTGEFRLPTNQLAAGGYAAPAGEGEATLYEASKFVATYIPLGASQNVADNSLLHCGDCHTVGQWKSGSSTNADGTATPVAIGAHGSANEYLLRNSLGTDAIHNSLTYVCFNCHIAGVAPGLTPGKAGFGALHPNQNKNQIMGYATTHAVSAFHIQCLADSTDNIGVTSRLAGSWEADKVEIYDFIPAFGATAIAPRVTGSTDPFLEGTDANSGNITGIACTNCHNSGLRSAFGGIHGGNNTYTDGLGRVQQSYRFMPGMGNYRYAPPGGWDGKDTSDPTLVTQATSGVGAGKPMGGCYTNGAADTNPGFSSCSHHGTSTAQTTAGGQAAGFRATYGGGTTGTPTAAEPTVREATAGNALVTRPLKY